VLLGGKTGSKDGGGQVRLSDIDSWEFAMPFHVGGGIGCWWHQEVCE
jgi:hypothetical protein